MLGGDTVVFTLKGFKKVKDLELYDEVLTPFGDFEPVVELGPWEEMEYKVDLSGYEDIYCSDDLLWYLYNNTSCYTDELDKDTATSNLNFELEGVSDKKLRFNPYNYAVVVPDNVPTDIMLTSLDNKLAFLAGLIDSPICELGEVDGIYKLYMNKKYKTLVDELLAFIRSLRLGCVVKLSGDVYVISFNITKYIDILPIRDEYKACYNYSSIGRNIMIKNIEKISEKSNNLSKNDKIMGRKVKVNRGYFLVGYSLVPVC